MAFNNLTQFLIFLVPDYQCLELNRDESIFYDYWVEYSDVQSKSQCQLVHSIGNITDCIYGYQYNYSLIYPTIVSEVSRA